MRFLRLALTALLVAAGVVGTARADTFAVLPPADVPNPAGAVVLPPALLQPPAAPVLRTPAELQPLWRAAGETYGVPWQILAAINSVETAFGQDLGPSSAGAIGWMQFMPATWAMWGLDADGDGVANPWSPEDAIYAAARYLAASGGAQDVSRAVFAYNHAGWYVDQVVRLARTYEARGAELTFRGAPEAAGLVAARAELAASTAAFERARLGRSLAHRARSAHAQLVDRLSARVSQARARLAALKAASRAAHVSLTAREGYVFPVGGGAPSVSVSQSHHDYPAADILTAAGTPVMALGAGTIEAVFHDSRCGNGFLLQVRDAQRWVYCHLATLTAAVVGGGSVAAGDLLGTVGSTGRASAPHLHLQLEHHESWPQREPWFAAFAGIAFHWTGSRQLEAHTFAVVDGPVDVVLFRR